MATLSRRKKIILLCAALGIGGYASYKVLNSACISRKRRRLASFVSSLFQLMETFSAGIDSTSLVAGDLRSFLLSDNDQIPRSLKQSLKIARSREFQDALTVFSSCVSRGLGTSVVDFISDDPHSPRRRHSKGGGGEKLIENREKVVILRNNNNNNNPPGETSTTSLKRHHEALPERLMQKLFSEPGVGFASAVLGSVARSTVLSVLEGLEKLNRSNQRSSEWDLRGLAPDACGSTRAPEDSNVLLDMICSSRGRALIGECVQAFVGTAVSVYLEKTKDINLCEQVVAGVTKPSHRPAVDELLTSVCSGAVETFVRTSHQVFTAPPAAPPPPQDSAPGSSRQQEPEIKDVRIVDEETQRAFNDDKAPSPGGGGGGGSSSEAAENVIVVTSSGGWVEGVSRTLAVPSNRKLLIDVAGTVTSEAIHSFFDVFLGVIGPYIRNNFKLRSISRSKSTRSVQTPVIIENNNNTGSSSSYWRIRRMIVPSRELVAKSLVILTIFLAIILHLLVDLPGVQQLRITS